MLFVAKILICQAIICFGPTIRTAEEAFHANTGSAAHLIARSIKIDYAQRNPGAKVKIREVTAQEPQTSETSIWQEDQPKPIASKSAIVID